MKTRMLKHLAKALESGHTPEEAVSHTMELYVVVPGGTAADIPTAECLSRHLPHGRQPTRAEVEAAIRACKESSMRSAI